jgi:hypothetical protein
MTHVFRSPKYQKELRMQYGPHKAISDSKENSKAASVRPGSRPQATSVKLDHSHWGLPRVKAPSLKPQASQAPSNKLQAQSDKLQASSRKRQAL